MCLVPDNTWYLRFELDKLLGSLVMIQRLGNRVEGF